MKCRTNFHVQFQISSNVYDMKKNSNVERTVIIQWNESSPAKNHLFWLNLLNSKKKGRNFYVRYLFIKCSYTTQPSNKHHVKVVSNSKCFSLVILKLLKRGNFLLLSKISTTFEFQTNTLNEKHDLCKAIVSRLQAREFVLYISDCMFSLNLT